MAISMLRGAYFPKGVLSFVGKLECGVPKFPRKIFTQVQHFRLTDTSGVLMSLGGAICSLY